MARPDRPGRQVPDDSTDVAEPDAAEPDGPGRDGAPSPPLPRPPSVVIVHKRPSDDPDPILPDGVEPGLPPDALEPDGPTRSVRRAIDQLVGQIEGGLADRRDEDRS